MTNINSWHKNILLACIAVLALCFFGCASPKSVEGGPRDKTPPKFLKMEPKNLTTNFTATDINIEFDEYFKLQNQYKEFNISPDVERQPILKVKQKTLEIKFQDTLQKNTTYTLNFGNMIADINESNVIKNFTYVFSTGPKLDSLSLTGKVTDAITGLPVLDATAFILPLNRDTLLGKGKPSIFSTTDSSGNFKMQNLRADSYKLYVIKETGGGDKIYQQPTDEIGFLRDTIKLSGNVTDKKIRLFKEEPTVFRMGDRKINNDGSILITWNQKLRKPTVVVTEPSNLDVGKQFKFNKTNDSVRVWLPDMSFDSVKVSILEEGKLQQTIRLTRGKKDTYVRPMIPADNVESNQLNPNQPLKLTFPMPVTAVDPSKITVLEDSVKRTNFQLTKDSLDFLSYLIRFPWAAKTKYEISYAEGAFTGPFNAKNKAFKKNFELGSADDYGTLELKITVPEQNKSYVVQVINDKKEVVNQLPMKRDSSVVFRNYRAGKYFLRIVYDTNGNGIWDTGNVRENRQPEQIYNEPKELSIRANWERKELVAIPKELPI